MKIKMIQGLTGPDITWHSGSIQDTDDGIAHSLVVAGIAEYVDKAEGVKPSATPAKRSRKAKSTKVTNAEKR